MRQGDKINCPACHNQTIVKEKVEMDGWTVVDRIFVCAFCGVKLGSAADAESDEQRGKKAVSGLAALFETKLADAPIITEEAGDRHFCKYCEHYVSHAFVERCQLHKREITGMQSCRDFKKKKEKNDTEKPIF